MRVAKSASKTSRHERKVRRELMRIAAMRPTTATATSTASLIQ
jgi:hypothetical protein